MKQYICPLCSHEYDEPYCTKCNQTIEEKYSVNYHPILRLVLVIITIIVFIIIAYCSCVQENNPACTKNNTTDDDKISAWTMAKHYVEQQLKAPKSADFPWYDKSYVTASGNKYTVSAYVDAENSFGANVRTYFTVTMTRNGDNWENIKVTFK